MWPVLSVFAEQLAPSDIVSRFDQLEIESIDANITIALDTLHDSGTQSWFSASNQAIGTIEIVRSYEFDSKACREIRIVSKQEGFTDQRTISYCQDDDFYWHPLTYRLQISQ